MQMARDFHHYFRPAALQLHLIDAAVRFFCVRTRDARPATDFPVASNLPYVPILGDALSGKRARRRTRFDRRLIAGGHAVNRLPARSAATSAGVCFHADIVVRIKHEAAAKKIPRGDCDNDHFG